MSTRPICQNCSAARWYPSRNCFGIISYVASNASNWRTSSTAAINSSSSWVKDMDDIESVAGVRGEREKEFVLVRMRRRQGHSYFLRQRDKDYSSNSISERVRYCVRPMRGNCTDGWTTYLGVRRCRQGGCKKCPYPKCYFTNNG